MKIRKVFKLISPVFLFCVLFIPYQIVNSEFIVNWLGCGCPVVDEFGNAVQSNFNANDFTTCFWHFIVICEVALAVFISKKEIQKKWLKLIYIVIILVVSLMIANYFSVAFMWK